MRRDILAKVLFPLAVSAIAFLQGSEGVHIQRVAVSAQGQIQMLEQEKVRALAESEAESQAGMHRVELNLFDHSNLASKTETKVNNGESALVQQLALHSVTDQSNAYTTTEVPYGARIVLRSLLDGSLMKLTVTPGDVSLDKTFDLQKYSSVENTGNENTVTFEIRTETNSDTGAGRTNSVATGAIRYGETLMFRLRQGLYGSPATASYLKAKVANDGNTPNDENTVASTAQWSIVPYDVKYVNTDSGKVPNLASIASDPLKFGQKVSLVNISTGGWFLVKDSDAKTRKSLFWTTKGYDPKSIGWEVLKAEDVIPPESADVVNDVEANVVDGINA